MDTTYGYHRWIPQTDGYHSNTLVYLHPSLFKLITDLFPIAIGIVDIEDEDNWTWFMRELRIILNDGRVIVFVSDRHKGLLESVSTVFPGHPHSFCTIHIKNNLKTKMLGKPAEVKDSLLKKFDRVAYAYTISRFQKQMEEFKNSAGSKVAKWLDTLPPEHYSHAYFPGKRYGEMTSNAAESLNAKYVKLRQLPVLGLVDGIRTMLMNDMTQKREKSLKWKGSFCPSINKKIKAGVAFGQSWSVLKSSEGVYEVQAKKSVCVDLSWKTCTCYSWQTNGFPCAHAFAAIHRSGLELEKFIDPYYHTEMYQKAYAIPIIPIDTIDMPFANPNDLQVLPPICKRQAGRPKRKRGEGASDEKRHYQCGRCHGYGHNSRGCNEVAQD